MPLNNVAGGLQWKPEHDVQLRLMAVDSTPYRVIAATLNEMFGTAYTKNAIVGRAMRIGLSKPAAVRQPNPDRIRVRNRTPAKPRKKIEILHIFSANGNSNALRVVKTVSMEMARLRCAEIEPLHKSLLDLECGDCRQPYGDGPFTFCGHLVKSGSSYCPAHHQLNWEPPRALVDKIRAREAA